MILGLTRREHCVLLLNPGVALCLNLVLVSGGDIRTNNAIHLEFCEAINALMFRHVQSSVMILRVEGRASRAELSYVLENIAGPELHRTTKPGHLRL